MKQLKSAKLLKSANAICHVGEMLEKFSFWFHTEKSATSDLHNSLAMVVLCFHLFMYLRDCAVITVQYIAYYLKLQYVKATRNMRKASGSPQFVWMRLPRTSYGHLFRNYQTPTSTTMQSCTEP